MTGRSPNPDTTSDPPTPHQGRVRRPPPGLATTWTSGHRGSRGDSSDLITGPGGRDGHRPRTTPSPTKAEDHLVVREPRTRRLVDRRRQTFVVEGAGGRWRRGDLSSVQNGGSLPDTGSSRPLQSPCVSGPLVPLDPDSARRARVGLERTRRTVRPSATRGPGNGSGRSGSRRGSYGTHGRSDTCVRDRSRYLLERPGTTLNHGGGVSGLSCLCVPKSRSSGPDATGHLHPLRKSRPVGLSRGPCRSPALVNE